MGDTLHVNNKAVKQNTYDAIVIGSGISGGWAAKELCEKGLKTLVLERGRMVEHIKDYTDTATDIWDLPHRGRITQEDYKTNPIQTKIYAYGEVSKHFFANDTDCPYTQTSPFIWIRGYQVGGRSLVWGRQCYRWSDLDFEANAKDGHGTDWPIRYKDLAPWYDYVEPFVGISGQAEGIAHLPDSKFLPPMQMNCAEDFMKQQLLKFYGNSRKMTIGRVANHTAKVGDRGPCQFRNKCETGCPFSGYFSSNSATLPAAMKTGNLSIRPHSIVTDILYNKDKKRATGVRILDTETNKTEEFYSNIVFVNASTINTAWILLHSTSDAFPNGFGNSSGQLGHNLMDHHLGAGASGQLDMFQDKYYYGRKANIVYLPRFRNVDEASKHPDFTRGYAFQCSAGRDGWGHYVDGEAIGPKFKEAIGEPGIWHLDMAGFGETLPYYDNRVTLDTNKKDKWGLPVIAIDCTARDNEWAMRKDEVESAVEMLEKIGAKNISTRNSHKPEERVFSVHDMGIARMGNDPKTSILNAHNQMHDVKNVFITDGSCMASSACQNPSLTYMALTARACDYAVGELKKGNI